ncbi:tRNA (adenosine(37)-N6)-dimethylallyltransferase MiaA [bacterium]|nr:tRNA (adenosine(37)-N6)-dimethylallyltransferase MiaA [bacterium]
MPKKLCLAIVGPTASGKTGFAIELAKRVGGEIVCVDSTTVYKGFDIGTSKPTAQQQQQVPHHLLDILDPDDAFNASDFVARARKHMEEISSRGKIPLLVGGSYFYLRALQQGMYPTGGYDDSTLESLTDEYSTDAGLDKAKLHEALSKADPAAAAALHPNDSYRVLRALALTRQGVKPSELKPSQGMEDGWLWMKYAMAVSRKRLETHIAERTNTMVRSGLAEEVRGLQAKHPKAKALGSIGYAETARFLKKEISEETWITEINQNTRRLLKRQTTWLRSDEEIRYVDARDVDRVELEIRNLQSVLGS